MPTLLTCTDGSLYARSVYDHSAWAAARLDAEVHVLHLLEHPENPAQSDISGAIGLDASAELMDELVSLAETQGRVALAKAAAFLADARAHLTLAGVKTIVLEKRHGSLVDSIAEFDAAAGLVILGKRGEHADFARLHLGSNLERVIRTCRHPVLVASRAFLPIAGFVLAYDGSPSVLKAVEFVLRSPLLQGLRCHLVRAGKVDDTARYYLEETAAKLRAAGYHVTTQATAGPADEVIGAAVKEQQANLLVMGAYGHSRIREFIVGSTTTALIRTVATPVLVVR